MNNFDITRSLCEKYKKKNDDVYEKLKDAAKKLNNEKGVTEEKIVNELLNMTKFSNKMINSHRFGNFFGSDTEELLLSIADNMRWADKSPEHIYEIFKGASRIEDIFRDSDNYSRSNVEYNENILNLQTILIKKKCYMEILLSCHMKYDGYDRYSNRYFFPRG